MDLSNPQGAAHAISVQTVVFAGSVCWKLESQSLFQPSRHDYGF